MASNILPPSFVSSASGPDRKPPSPWNLSYINYPNNTVGSNAANAGGGLFFTNGIWRLEGNTNINLGNFLYNGPAINQQISSDFTFTAKVESVGGECEIVAAPSLSLLKPCIYVRAFTPDNGGWATQTLHVNSSGTVFNGSTSADFNLPLWLQIRRSGNNIYGYYSIDGVTFTNIAGPFTDITGNVYIALISNTSTVSGWAYSEFSGVTVQ